MHPAGDAQAFRDEIPMRTIVFVLTASVALSTTVQSASFDCSEASSEAERIICSDDLISHADDLLNDVFLKAL